MDAGQYAEACPKLVESERIDPAVGTLGWLAQCYEKVGKTASAWATYKEAESLAHQVGQSEREQVAKEHADALEPTLSRVVVDAASLIALADATISRNGTSLARPLWGKSIPVDAGKQVFEARAPGYVGTSFTVDVASGPGVQTVIIPVLAPEPAPPIAAPTPVAVQRGESRERPSEPHPPERNSIGTQRVLALVAAGAGVAGAAIGTVFGLQSRSDRDEAALHCDGAACADQEGVDLKTRAIDKGNIATVGFVVAAAGLGAGALLWFTASSDAERRTTVGLGPTSIIVKGTW
jgi:serine/threonine-protein kinase